MPKTVSFIIENKTFQGELTYGDKNEIKCTLLKPHSEILQDMFESENGYFFEISGTMEDNKAFTGLNCFVRSGTNPLGYLLVDKNRELNYSIYIGTLYIGATKIDKNTKNIQKCEFKVSHQIPFLKNTEQIQVYEHNFKIQFNETVVIEFDKSVSLDELNQVLYNLKIFFQVLVLDKDIEIVKKIFHIADKTKIKEIVKYQKDELVNQLIKNYLIKNYDKFDIESSLNLWFGAKEKYGRIFDYLSEILSETTIKHLDFKLFALAQWVEAYSTVLFETPKKEKNIKRKEKELKKAIKISNLLDEDKNYLIEHWNYDKKGQAFIEKLKELFSKNDFFINLFDSNENLLKDIKYYRNSLTHINVKDTLNMQQVANIYEILKNFIYLLIMEELQVKNDKNYAFFKEEAKYYYKKYDALSKTISLAISSSEV
jgi:hypothetical protein